MRKLLFGAALLALLTVLVAAPAMAAPTKQAVSANDYLIGQSMIKAGLIPPFASQAQVANAVRAYLSNAGDSNLALKLPQVQRSLAGKRTGLGRYLVTRGMTDPSADQTYTSNTLVILVEFGNDPWPSGDSTGHNMVGPLHGSVPAPPANDNADFWPGDFSRQHYQDMLFGNSFMVFNGDGSYKGTSTDTMASYYLEQSHGAYTVSGDIAEWVKLDQPESWYGANAPGGNGDDLNGPVWRVAQDAVAKLAATDPTFDWAKYDKENTTYPDQPFNQPDGYVDHLILIHAGVDESAGGGAQGADAIWAHSWWVQTVSSGGPGDNPGYEIPGSTGAGPGGHVWVGPYTINPEDGGIGVFCHEFGHDLGLPDEYDTTYVGEETSGFWTLMASGSWLGREFGLGTKPAPMNVWDKWALGFIAPKTAARGKNTTVTLQPAATGSYKNVGVFIPLPKATHSIPLSGADGTKEWYSTYGDNLNNKLTLKAPVAIPAGTPTLSVKTWYEIETGYDFGYVEVSTNGGSTWTSLQTTAGSPVHTVSDGGGGYGLTGDGTAFWTAGPAIYDLTPFQGASSALFRFRYRTDSGVAWRGWEVTNVMLNATPIADSAFASSDWIMVDGAYKATSTRYYVAEYRNHDGFDEALKNCYQWNYDDPTATKVDWFRYNTGLHLIYRDTWFQDNNVGQHPGEGGWQVVDARPIPDFVHFGPVAAGTDAYFRTRVQVRDAAFSKASTFTQIIYLVTKSAPDLTYYDLAWGDQLAPGKLAQPWFDDSKTWWYAAASDAGTKVPKLGVRIQVKSQTPDSMKIWVDNVK